MCLIIHFNYLLTGTTIATYHIHHVSRLSYEKIVFIHTYHLFPFKLMICFSKVNRKKWCLIESDLNRRKYDCGKKSFKARTGNPISHRYDMDLSNQLIFLRLQVQKSEQRLSIGVKSAQMFRFINDIRNTNKTGLIRDRITKAPRTSGCDRGYYACRPLCEND